MNFSNWKVLQIIGCRMNSTVFKCSMLLLFILTLRTTMLSPIPGFQWFQQKSFYLLPIYHYSSSPPSVRTDKFLEVPQIIWGLNNQKIAFARACLTARLFNRTLLLPNLTANLVYKEMDLSEPVAFDKIFNFGRFNSLCNGFVRLGRYSDLTNQTDLFELQKGSGRKWTKDRDLSQLKNTKEGSTDNFEVIGLVGKHPFLWHDHWPVKDYAKIFQCLALIDEIEEDAGRVVSTIQHKGNEASGRKEVPYIAVHMRIEKDWMIHCKKVEQRFNMSHICSSKEQIMERVAAISGLQKPVAVYLAVADSLLEDNSILSGWAEGLLPFEKKRLGVSSIYNKHSYLVQAAIDYEVCLRANVFVGNSYSTFSSLIVLQRTQRLTKTGVMNPCVMDLSFATYAYNILGEFGGPHRWMTDMSASSLQSISYGTDNILC